MSRKQIIEYATTSCWPSREMWLGGFLGAVVSAAWHGSHVEAVLFLGLALGTLVVTVWKEDKDAV